MRLHVLVALLVVACGDVVAAPDAAMRDTDLARDATTAPAPPAAPTPPTLPSFAPCPDGWSARELDGATICEPWAADPPDCADGEMRVPGRPGCERVGAACPTTDPFATALPTDVPVVFVLEGAVGGDGSRGAPWGRVQDGLFGAAPGTVVAIGRGRYDEALSVFAGVTLHGACVAETTLTNTGSGAAVVTAMGVGVEVRDLRFELPSGPSITVARGASVRAVAIESIGATGAAFIIRPGAAADLAGVAVRDGRMIPGLTFSGRGVEAIGASLSVTRSVFERNRDVAIVTNDGATTTLADVAIRDTEARPDGSFGVGVSVTDSAIDIDRLVLENNRLAALTVSGARGIGQVEHLVVGDTQSDLALGEGGFALSIEDGGTVTARRIVMERNRDVAVRLIDGATLDLQDAVVSNTFGRGERDDGGRGINVQSSSSMTAARVVVARARDVGLVVLGDEVSVDVEDLVVRDTLGLDSDGRFGRGVDLGMGATATLRRALVADNRDIGVFVEPGSALDAEDLEIRGTRSRRSDSLFGRGAAVQEAVVMLSRARISDNRELGLMIAGAGARLLANDLVIEDTAAEEASGSYGRGLDVELGAVVELERAAIARSRDVGLLAIDDGTSVTLRDVSIRQTVARACVETTCPDSPAGTAVSVSRGARLDATVFAIDGAALCGVQVSSAGEIDLHDGLVAGAPIGACVQVADYDIDRLRDRVEYRDNGVNIETTDLPVPDASPPSSP